MLYILTFMSPRITYTLVDKPYFLRTKLCSFICEKFSAGLSCSALDLVHVLFCIFSVKFLLLSYMISFGAREG
uniref:Putative ovule protein n=1 Tax=Solanum chacoense TaxID=4108 RepID=A0A0V0GZX5_SOLCH